MEVFMEQKEVKMMAQKFVFQVVLLISFERHQ